MSKTFAYSVKEIQTPLGIAPVRTPDNPLVISTILRAGLPFHQGFLSYFDYAENAFVSAYRKYKDTLKFDIHIEYIASPNKQTSCSFHKPLPRRYVQCCDENANGRSEPQRSLSLIHTDSILSLSHLN